MLGVGVVSCEPDSVVWNDDTFLFGGRGLTPFKIEDVVRDIIPLDATVLRVVELLVDSAWLIIELSAGSP